MRASKKMLRIVLIFGAILILISRFKSEWLAPIFIAVGVLAFLFWLVLAQITMIDKIWSGSFFKSKNQQVQQDHFVDDYDSLGGDHDFDGGGS